MPRFTERVQKKVDARHNEKVGDIRETKALLDVPVGARMAMPVDADRYFWHKSRFLNTARVKALIRGLDHPVLDPHTLEERPRRVPTVPEIDRSFQDKVAKAFHFHPEQWEAATLHITDDFLYDHPFCFNSQYQADPMTWIWNKDRQISLVVWLESAEEAVLEFPYLIPTGGGEPYRMMAKEGTAFAFPSHPMYAFRVLRFNTPFLLTHATHPKVAKPPVLTQQIN